jgi:hypothetical protein
VPWARRRRAWWASLALATGSVKVTMLRSQESEYVSGPTGTPHATGRRCLTSTPLSAQIVHLCDHLACEAGSPSSSICLVGSEGPGRCQRRNGDRASDGQSVIVVPPEHRSVAEARGLGFPGALTRTCTTTHPPISPIAVDRFCRRGVLASFGLASMPVPGAGVPWENRMSLLDVKGQ